MKQQNKGVKKDIKVQKPILNRRLTYLIKVNKKKIYHVPEVQAHKNWLKRVKFYALIRPS